jgi:hypothetical protein
LSPRWWLEIVDLVLVKIDLLQCSRVPCHSKFRELVLTEIEQAQARTGSQNNKTCDAVLLQVEVRQIRASIDLKCRNLVVLQVELSQRWANGNRDVTNEPVVVQEELLQGWTPRQSISDCVGIVKFVPAEVEFLETGATLLHENHAQLVVLQIEVCQLVAERK